MKVIFAAFRHDPLDSQSRQGADTQFLDALIANGCDCHIVGPFDDDVNLFEKFFRRAVKRISRNAYVKHDFTNTIKAARKLNSAIECEKPDLIFSLYPAMLAFYRNSIPCVLRTDATIKGVRDQAPEFLTTAPMLRGITLWIEKKALRRCTRVVTHSEWSREILIQEYGIHPEGVVILPNPSSLLKEQISHNYHDAQKKVLDEPLRLLFIGTDQRRKGLKSAIEVVGQLNQAGITAILTVCGLSGQSSPTVKYVGKLRLEIPEELAMYVSLLREAHMLLHPALFDPAPRVTSEAAAFGTPTITNDVGGLATSVKDGVSGIVLPKGSPASTYVRAIMELVNDPERYQRLCLTTRERYEKELNWEVVGKQLVAILEEAVRENNKEKQL